MSESGKQVSVNLHHSTELKFEVDVSGRKVELNSAEVMGQAFTPMELFLVALGGCTAMDVQWIMDRQRQKLDKFDISLSGTRRTEDPMYYESIDLKYSFTGPNIRKDAVERAIRLSKEKYCSVLAMIKDSVKLKIAYSISNDSQTESVYTYGS